MLIYASALQHHPLSSELYLLITYHHLHPSAPFPQSSLLSTPRPISPSSYDDDLAFSLDGISPARTTLLLGLRLLPKSHELWREYIKLELGWVEALRRRWKLLGIDETEGERSRDTSQGDDRELLAGQGSFGPEGEEARKALLAGQLVMHAIKSALEAIPIHEGVGFREGLLGLLRIYPSKLRSKGMEVVYGDLEKMSGGDGVADARARLLVLTRRLYDRAYDSARKETPGIVLDGVELVEELGRIGKEIRQNAKMAKGSQWSEIAGSWLAAQLDSCAKDGRISMAGLNEQQCTCTSGRVDVPAAVPYNQCS